MWARRARCGEAFSSVVPFILFLKCLTCFTEQCVMQVPHRVHFFFTVEKILLLIFLYIPYVYIKSSFCLKILF